MTTQAVPGGSRIFQIVTVPLTLRSFFVEIVRRLEAEGFEVHAVSSPGDELERFGAETGSICHVVPMIRGISPAADVVSLVRLLRILRRERPDVVHSHMPKSGLLGTVAAWMTGVPVRLYTIHGLVFATRTGWRRRLLKGSERVACGLAHRVLCVSPSLREEVIAEGICARDKVGVVSYGSISGLDVERFRRTEETLAAAAEVRRDLGIPPDATVLGYVGRLVRDKGIEELAEVWSGLREEIDDLHLLLLGDFEAQDAISPGTRGMLEADPRVRIVGWQDDVVPYLLASDVQCLPSHREGFGMVLIEAAALEVPVVASRITGCRDAVADGVTGLLVEPRDAAGLKAALERLLRDPRLRRRMGAAGRRWVQDRFGHELVLEGLMDEYRRLMERRLRRRHRWGARAPLTVTA